MDNLLWNAKLLAVHRATPNPHACAQWYARLLGDTLSDVGDGTLLLWSAQRAIFFSSGAAKTVPHVIYAFDDAAQCRAYHAQVAARGVRFVPVPKAFHALIGSEAFALHDPDGRTLVFGVRKGSSHPGPVRPAARLQHFVCASTQAPAMLAFYRDTLGFIESDRVVTADGDLSSAFLRSDTEHHSFAVFRAPERGPDHHAYEVPDWNGIRDWADRCGDLEIPLWWGPGRHGVGNNLFFMIEDPEGYKVEFSAELEHMTYDQPYRVWPHGQRALNLWGSAWMRS